MVSWGAEILLLSIKLLSLLKRLIAAFFISLILKFGWIILRFVFYRLIVKIYKFYLSVIKKLEWNGFRNSPVLFLIKQKLVHIAVATVTLLLVITNISAKADDSHINIGDTAGNTILASLVESEFGAIDQGQLIEEFFYEEAPISPVQQKYRDNLAVVESDLSINTKMPQEAEADEFDAPTSHDNTAVVKPDIASTVKTTRPRSETVYYTVEPGDVIGSIAEKFNINVSTILWENNLTAYSVIRPGDRLTILPTNGVSYKVERGDSIDKIAKRYGIDKDEMIRLNKLDESKGLAYGQKLFLPGARKMSTTIARNTAQPTSNSRSGLQVLKDLVTKSPNAKPASGEKLNWPTVGYRITQYYTWKHHGLDVANKIGTPLYAVDDGVVEYSGWGTGYGNYVFINHGNGVKTKYAHASKLFVKKGDTVKKGETIAAMGSTGWSTGPHIHFEYIVNGVKYNPLNYLK